MKYPWKETPNNQCFFVPSLDPERTLKEGIKAGQEAGGLMPIGKIGIFDGKAGVLFYRFRNFRDVEQRRLAMRHFNPFESDS